jgi:type II secretory pathway pseudopilin PulG
MKRVVTKDEKGFSYLDLIVAIVILMVGVLASVSAITTALIRVYETEQRATAKQLALSALESVFAARDLERTLNTGSGTRLSWARLRNVSAGPDEDGVVGIFLDGWRPVRENLGADGIAGTADDACDAPGPCGTGPSANTSRILPFERRIAITDIDDPERPVSAGYRIAIRRVEIAVRYYVQGIQRQETLSTIITNY